MKKLILFFAISASLMPMACFSQTLYRTYYDYAKTHVHEEYYANSYGVKNGTYKEYSEYGGVLQEGTYKDDKKDGKWITRTDKGKLDRIESYKDDKLDGVFTSYYEDYGAKYKEGNFADDAPVGNWYKYSRSQNIWDDVPKSAFIGSEYVKLLKHYSYSSSALSNDFNQEDDYWGDYGQIINTYYPSGKKFQEGHYISTQYIQGWIGDFYLYYPNGNLSEFDENDTIEGYFNGKPIRSKQEWGNITGNFSKPVIIGTLFHKVWAWPGGSKDSIAIYKAQISAEQKAINEQNRKNELEQHKQDSIAAISRKKAELEQHRKDSLDIVSRKKAESEKGKRDSLSVMQQQINSLYDKFRGIYVGSAQSTLLGMPLVNQQTHQPIMKTTYPQGEYLFKKSDTLIKSMSVDLQKETDINVQLNKGKNIITLLNKLVALSGTDTKGIDKQMKKAETMDDIKRILGL